MNEIITLLIIFLIIWLFLYKQGISKTRNQTSNKDREKLNNLYQQDVESDKNRVTQKQIRALLIKLNLSPFVIGLFDETKDLKEYGFYGTFIPPFHIIDMTKKEQDFFKIDRYTPLFETMDDFLEVLAYDNILKGFIRYCPEDTILFKNDEVLTWDGIFVMQILTWHEDCKTDEEILNICNLLDLKYGKQILESIKNKLGTKYTDEQINEWENYILKKINGNIKPLSSN